MPFPESRGYLYSFPCGLLPYAKSAMVVDASLSLDAISQTLFLLLPISPFKRPYDYIESAQIIQNNLFKVI